LKLFCCSFDQSISSQKTYFSKKNLTWASHLYKPVYLADLSGGEAVEAMADAICKNYPTSSSSIFSINL
jgi:hypothetical protein